MSTIPQLEMSKVLVHELRRWGFAGSVAATTHHDGDAEMLEDYLANGVLDLVINPFDDASRTAAQRIVIEVPAPETRGHRP